jgi:transglutaminase-like putative cysteine protease
MDIRRAFAVSTYALVLTGILSLSIAEGSALIIVLATLLSLAAFEVAERRRRPIGRVATNLAVFGVVLLVPADYALVSGDAILTTTHFLLAVQIVKLFGQKAQRDYVQLFVVSLIHLGVAAVLTIELLFSVAFVVYMVVATWTLLLFLLWRELEDNAREEPGKVRSGRGLLASLGLASLATLAITVVVFFVFPRFSAVIFDVKRTRQAGRVSGFTEEIGLTDLSEIRENSDVVLRVEVKQAGSRLPAEPRWRGLAFDRYEGGTWRRSWNAPGASPLPSRRAHPLPTGSRGSQDGVWAIRRPGRSVAPEGEAAVYLVTQAPLGIDSNVLFGVPEVDEVAFTSTDRPTFVVIDRGDAMLGIGLPPRDVQYLVRSTPARREAARAAAVDPDAASGVDWLQLPSVPTLTARLRALAETVFAEAGARTPYERCEALERHLSTAYRYTLALEPTPEGSDPILRFLFETKEGHCELTATAFVLMCRTQGIPARLVNGFQTGQWNEYGGYWQVRQMEAHAWAEVKFAGEAGWVDFDPTPWSPGGGGFLSSLEKLQDYLRMRWINYVITYSLSDQLSVADRMRQTLDEWRRSLAARAAGLRDHIPKVTRGEATRGLLWIAGLGAIGLGLSWFLYSQRLRNGRRGAGRGRAARPVPFFEEWTRAAERRGFRRRVEETPLELARRAEAEGGPALRGAERLVRAFYRVRFAEESLPPDERAAVEAIVAAAAGRSPRPPPVQP